MNNLLILFLIIITPLKEVFADNSDRRYNCSLINQQRNENIVIDLVKSADHYTFSIDGQVVNDLVEVNFRVRPYLLALDCFYEEQGLRCLSDFFKGEGYSTYRQRMAALYLVRDYLRDGDPRHDNIPFFEGYELEAVESLRAFISKPSMYKTTLGLIETIGKSGVVLKQMALVNYGHMYICNK